MMASIHWAWLPSLLLVGCGEAQPSPTGEQVTTVDDACELATAAVVARGDYLRSQIVGCEGGPSEVAGGHWLLRLSGACHEEICGSVLLGWFVVDEATGKVYDMDYQAWQPGEQVISQ